MPVKKSLIFKKSRTQLKMNPNQSPAPFTFIARIQQLPPFQVRNTTRIGNLNDYGHLDLVNTINVLEDRLDFEINSFSMNMFNIYCFN